MGKSGPYTARSGAKLAARDPAARRPSKKVQVMRRSGPFGRWGLLGMAFLLSIRVARAEPSTASTETGSAETADPQGQA